MKYITPELKIDMFECESVITSSSSEVNEYVTYFDDISEGQRRKVRLENMKELTQFVF